MGAACSAAGAAGAAAPPHAPLPPSSDDARAWRAADLAPAAVADLHCAPLAELLAGLPRTPPGEAFGGGVLTPRQAAVLELSLASAYRGRLWCRLYQLSRHGASLSTLLRRTRGVAPTLLCVRTEAGSVLGAFSPSAWWDAGLPLGVHRDLPPLALPGSPFFGFGGGAFVFSFAAQPGARAGRECTPGFTKSAWSPTRAAQLQYLRVEPSKGGGVATAIGVGGGGQSFALLLDEGLERGRSGECAAFGSPGLAPGEREAEEEVFRALEVEVWGFASGSEPCRAAGEEGAPGRGGASVCV